MGSPASSQPRHLAVSLSTSGLRILLNTCYNPRFSSSTASPQPPPPCQQSQPSPVNCSTTETLHSSILLSDHNLSYPSRAPLPPPATPALGSQRECPLPLPPAQHQEVRSPCSVSIQPRLSLLLGRPSAPCPPHLLPSFWHIFPANPLTWINYPSGGHSDPWVAKGCRVREIIKGARSLRSHRSRVSNIRRCQGCAW